MERSKGIEDREKVMQSVIVTNSRVTQQATISVVQPVGFGGSSQSGSKLDGASMADEEGSKGGNSVGSKAAKDETDQAGGGGAKARKSKKNKGNVSIISRKTHSGTQNDKTRKYLGLKDKKSSRKSTKSKKTS